MFKHALKMKPLGAERLGAGCSALLGLGILVSATTGVQAWETDSSRTSRDCYNEGTRKFQEGELRDAESALQAAVARNEDRVQPDALYNLAHVRFKQGVKVLKETEESGASKQTCDAVSTQADAALRTADAALMNYDLNAIVAAYMQGRGARKELKAALKAVEEVLESYGAVLSRWQRSSGDFKSAHELRINYADARFNSEVVDRHIAKLVDKLEAMKMCMQGMGKQRQELKNKMKQLKDRLPENLKQQCPGDEEDEEEEEPKKPKAGEKEPKPRDGREIWLTPEEALRLLEAMKLDGYRKLPMGFDEAEKREKRSGQTW